MRAIGERGRLGRDDLGAVGCRDFELGGLRGELGGRIGLGSDDDIREDLDGAGVPAKHVTRELGIDTFEQDGNIHAAECS